MIGPLTSSKTCRYVKGTNIQKPPNNHNDGISAIFVHPMNVLLLCFPVGIAAFHLKWDKLWCFWLNFFAMIPLAKILGDATEELAASLKNDMIAGLLNATFGNAVEMVIMVQTLRAGLLKVVKTTLLGSVLSNTLLVLGMSFFCGGVITMKSPPALGNVPQQDYDSTTDPQCTMSGFLAEEKIQSFSLLGALVNTSMLLVSCLTFSLVTAFRLVLYKDNDNVFYKEEILLPVSRISSVVIIMAYIAYVVFQLVTHKQAMADSAEDEQDDGSTHSALLATVVLCITTLFVSYSSELLVDAIGEVTEQAHISSHFIGIILLPIVGNACEHAAAVRFAVQDKLGLSVSIAVGSSTQIALFVVPFSVLIGWAIDQPMDLNFGTLNSTLITLSVIVVLSMVVDGQSNWFQGYLLCSVYTIIAVMYWYLPDDVHDGVD